MPVQPMIMMVMRRRSVMNIVPIMMPMQTQTQIMAAAETKSGHKGYCK